MLCHCKLMLQCTKENHTSFSYQSTPTWIVNTGPYYGTCKTNLGDGDGSEKHGLCNLVNEKGFV